MQALLYAAYDLVKELDKKKLNIPEYLGYCRPCENTEVAALHGRKSARDSINRSTRKPSTTWCSLWQS